ncbi:MAG: DUF169 domain-containing protein [bacterium]|nr:DUF169 domain-containing protein [bacterium]
MTDILKQLNDSIQKHIRPQTYPLAIRMVKPGEDLPERVKRPLRDLGIKSAICQGIGLARKYGWAMALGHEDISCPLAKSAFGFEPLVEHFTSGCCCEGMYTETADAGARTESELPKFSFRQYEYFLTAPIERTTFEPDVFLVYGNSAQVMRLLAGSLWKPGGYLTSRFSSRLDCADICIETMHTQKPQVILPCYGDRLFGQTQDDEMAFAFPAAHASDLIAGLEGTHKGGIRYPIPTYMRFTAEFPEKYQELEKYWKEE